MLAERVDTDMCLNTGIRQLKAVLQESQIKPQRIAVIPPKGLEGYDFYNPSAAIPIEEGPMRGTTIIAFRAEPRKTEKMSKVVICRLNSDGVYQSIEGIKPFNGQDPRLAIVQGQLTLSIVHVDWHGYNARWKQLFYKGPTIFELQQFAEGPAQMKDTLLYDNGNGCVGVLTRPQGIIGGLGRIGSTKINKLENLSPNVIKSAPLLTDNIPSDEWIGGNSPLDISSDLRILRVVGHHAQYVTAEGEFTKDGRSLRAKEYVGCLIIIDNPKHEIAMIKPFAIREMFPEDETKSPLVKNIVFPGGLTLNGSMEFHAGLSDATHGKITGTGKIVEYVNSY